MMSLINRIRRVPLPVLSRKASGAARRMERALFLWPQAQNGRLGAWRQIDFEQYAQEGFTLNGLVYSAIMYKYRAQGAAPLRAWTGEKDKPEPLDPKHPLAQLVARPNPYQSWAEYMGAQTVYLNLSGNAFTWLERESKTNRIVKMWPLRPDWVWVVPHPNNREVLGYVYKPGGSLESEGVPMVPEDVIHAKLPDPLDPLGGLGKGLSPMASIAPSVNVDNAVTRFINIFFQRGALTAGLLKFDSELSDDEIHRIKERWHEQYGGADNWSEVGVLEKGGNYERIGYNFSEMGFDAIDERNESRVLGPFGVPGILLGTRIGLRRSTFSNYEQARKAFWEDTFVPELAIHQDELEYYLQDEKGSAWVAYDYSDTPALRGDIMSTVTAWGQLVDRGIDIHVAADVVGLSLPADAAAEAPPDEGAAQPEPEPSEPSDGQPQEGEAGPEAQEQADEEDGATNDNQAQAKGGPGSGNYAHSGRPGQRGGSAPSARAPTAAGGGAGGGAGAASLPPPTSIAEAAQRYDDVAIADQAEATMLYDKLGKEGGFTYQTVDNTSPSDGLMLSIYPGREKVISQTDVSVESIIEYTQSNKDLLVKGDHYLGAWADEGKVYLDVSVRTTDAGQAVELCRQNKQLAYFDLGKMETVYVEQGESKGLRFGTTGGRVPRGLQTVDHRDNGPGQGHTHVTGTGPLHGGTVETALGAVLVAELGVRGGVGGRKARLPFRALPETGDEPSAQGGPDSAELGKPAIGRRWVTARTNRS